MRQWQLLLMPCFKHVEGSEVKGRCTVRFANVDTVNSNDIVAVEAMHNESQPQGHDVTAAEHKEHLIMFCTNCKTNLGRICCCLYILCLFQ
jgi:hypothetical protein